MNIIGKLLTTKFIPTIAKEAKSALRIASKRINIAFQSTGAGLRKSAEEVGLFEHGLHEIKVDPKEYQEIAQTVVHSPQIEGFNPETMVKIEGQVIEFPFKNSKDYTVSQILDDDGIIKEFKVCFSADGGRCTQTVKIPRTTKLSQKEINILKEKYGENWMSRGKNIDTQTVESPHFDVPNFMGFRIPEGCTSYTKDLGNGVKEIKFYDKDGIIMRKIKLKDGQPVSYTDHRTICKNAIYKPDGSIDEASSVYTQISANTNYELVNENVATSIQTKHITHHIKGFVQKAYTTKVKTTTLGDGKVMQEITIDNGTKHFSISSKATIW